MDWQGWATFGFGATVALTAVLVAAQLGGLTRMDIPMMLGTIFVEDPDKARVVGFFVHLINGQVFALLYASGFAAINDANWGLGALFGGLHGFAALTLIVPLSQAYIQGWPPTGPGRAAATCSSHPDCSVSTMVGRQRSLLSLRTLSMARS